VPAKSESKIVVYAALAGNLLIAATKFVAGFLTGSSAMVSEAIHSTVDTGNQGLMILGMARAKRPPDEQHPFGHGLELYFWSFVVALLIFGLGAGMSVYEGIEKLIKPHPVTSFTTNYIVLAVSAIFEGISWTIAFREFNKTRGRRDLLDAVHASKDPTIFTVLFEDSAALIGLVIAFAGLAAVQYLNLAWADAAASIMIGSVLAVTAMALARETKSLLTGEAASPAMVGRIRDILLRGHAIEKAGHIATIHFGPNEVLATARLTFCRGTAADTAQQSMECLEAQIKGSIPAVKHIYLSRDHSPNKGQELACL
jgi:cation diffusion facilitator family transporter